ncbi:MAG: peptidylprolyl isomerase [Deltaproteobacteria bacterium]|nr:peptidylprolyl isomerase [Deltaproteobacteria bacterium]
MLRTMHKYRKSLFGFLIVGLVCMMMTGFGVHLLDQRQEPYAVKIDEHVITYEDISRERRNLEARYRNMFGQNYAQLAQQLNLNIGQQAVDKSINDYIIEREASRQGLTVGDEGLGSLIKTSLFGKDRPFDVETYRAFLRQVGMTSATFEQSVRQEALRQQYIGILHLASLPSLRESRSAVEREEAKFSFDYVEFNPADFLKDIKDPDSVTLTNYFDERNADYELPPRVSYDYVVLDPEKFLDLVEVTPEDVELYYSDHQSQFTSDEQVHARHIQINYSKDSTPTEMAALKEKAEEVHQKALSGESFDSLALQYSDDITTKGNGGDLGWISRGKMAKQFDAAAFKTKEGGITEVVPTDYGFHVIKIEGVKAAAPKELNSVRKEIEAIIRKQEAPAYTADKARTLFDKWQAGTRSLADFAVENNLVAASTNGLLDREKDPENGLRGLTAKVIAFPEETKQAVDVGDKTVLVSLKQYKDQEVPPLEQVRSKVIENWKKQQSVKMAKAAADSLLKATESQENLKTAAQAAKLNLKQAKDLSVSSRARTAPFNDPDIEQELFVLESVGKKPSRVFESNGTYLIIQVANATRPDKDAIDSKIAEYRRRGADSFLQTLALSMTNRLKAHSVIDIAPGLLTQES